MNRLLQKDRNIIEYLRVMILHFGITHLMNNMVMLGALGWNLELEIRKASFYL